MSISSLLQQALAHHQQGRYQQAQDLYYQVLMMDARQFDALHLLGVLLRQRGDADAAVAMIGRALDVDPKQASAHCNLGVALADVGRLDDAVHSYERAISLQPAYAMAYGNRGNALRKLGRLEEALHSHDKALLVAPASADVLCNRALVLLDLERAVDALDSVDRALESKLRYAEAHCARGSILQAMQQYEAAIDSYSRGIDCYATQGAQGFACAEAHCNRGMALHRVHAFDEALRDVDRAIAMHPAYALAHTLRGHILRDMGRLDDAAGAYQSAMQHGADPVKLQFALASLGKAAAPAAPPEGYVKELFDQYAGHFDQHLRGVLEYRIPEYVGASLQAAAAQHDGVTLELGCGTGLCADVLRPLSRVLIGVDLSQPMLDKARLRGQYDELVCADMVACLQSRQLLCDLVVAADVFVYVGDLAPVFAAVQRSMREQGLFCFSVESSMEECDFVLQPSNRYAHSRRYLERLARSHQFDVVSIEQKVVRREHQQALSAYLIVLRHTAKSN